MRSRRRVALAVAVCLAGLSGWSMAGAAQETDARQRVRELGIIVGNYAPGQFNAITDVPGVRVGHQTLISGEGALKPGQGPVRTGVTVIIPRDDVWHKKVAAGSFVLNGTGEMTGLSWVAESGFLEYPIALTNTLNVPRVANGVMSWMIKQYPAIGIEDDTLTPVVAECDDGRLNDIQGRHVSEQDVIAALDGATSGPVKEGTVGAGTGMVSYGFKGGIGTASRIVPEKEGGYTIGVLVNANHGRKPELVVGGVGVGGARAGSERRLHHHRHCDRCAARWSSTDASSQARRAWPGPHRLDRTPWQRRFHPRLLHRQCHSALSQRTHLYPDPSRRHPSESDDYRHRGGYRRGDPQRPQHGHRRCRSRRPSCGGH